MQPHRPRSVVVWLSHARGDLALARVQLGPKVMKELLCFHAQQAAEKAIKAVLIGHGIEPPRTHNITALINLLPPEVPQPEDVLASRVLTSYAAMTRYPGQAGEVSEDDYREAVRLAEAVVGWAEGLTEAEG